MGLISWIKDTFNKLLKAFNDFIKEAFDLALKQFIGEFKDFAINTIAELAKTDLQSDSKRAEAFKKIKEEATKKGKDVKDYMINILIELAVARLKAIDTKG